MKRTFMKLLNLLILFGLSFWVFSVQGQTSVAEAERVELRKNELSTGYYTNYGGLIIDTFRWEKYELAYYISDTLRAGIDGFIGRFPYEKPRRIPPDTTLAKVKAFVSSSKDTSFYGMIRKMKNLKVLILEHQDFSRIPDFIFDLKHLRILSLEDNNLTEISPDIAALTELEFLNLWGNKLQGDIPAFAFLSKLKVLRLGYNALETFPSSIIKMKELEILGLNNNKIGAIPANIDALESLKELDISFNALTEIPAKLSQLKKLESLDLHHNDLTELPANIDQLSNLKHLNIYENNIKIFPSAIGSLSRLKSIQASDNLLQTIPETITKLIDLEFLDLSDNQIRSIPNGLNLLKNLQILDLGANLLTSTGTALDGLSRLKKLYLGGNPNLIFASKTYTWNALEVLDLSNCKLTQIPPGVYAIKTLQSLDLSKNKGLTVSSPLKSATSLKTLTLAANDLKEIPAFLFFMPSLKLIDLKNNQITYLPKEHPYREGPELDIRGNPISEQPDELLKLSTWKNYICIAPELYFAKKRYEKALEVASFILAKKGQNPYYDDDRCIDPKNHIRYAMYAQDAQQTIDLATRFLNWHSTETYMNARLIIGYILNKQFPEAEKLIQEWKGKKFSNGKDAHGYILNEILLMEQNGIQHVDFARAKQLLK
jgi:leucine-rich repeat protein SHOC2